FAAWNCRRGRIPHSQKPRHTWSFDVGLRQQRQKNRRAAMNISRPMAAPQNRLLRCLPPADFALLARHLTSVSLEQGKVLSEAGDFVEHAHFPHTAVVSFLAVMRHGQTIETATIGRTGIAGGVAGMGRWRGLARAVVLVPGTASRIPCDRFRAAFKK